MAPGLRILFIRNCLVGSPTPRRLCWLVLIVVVRGSARTGIRVLGGAVAKTRAGVPAHLKVPSRRGS
jgi:hypothetical protein